MSHPTLEYRSPHIQPRARPEYVRGAGRCVAIVGAVSNVLVLLVAACFRGLESASIAALSGLAVNGLLATVALSCVPIIRAKSRPASLDRYVWTSVLIPVAGAVLTLLFAAVQATYGR